MRGITFTLSIVFYKNHSTISTIVDLSLFYFISVLCTTNPCGSILGFLRNYYFATTCSWVCNLKVVTITILNPILQFDSQTLSPTVQNLNLDNHARECKSDSFLSHVRITPLKHVLHRVVIGPNNNPFKVCIEVLGELRFGKQLECDEE